jgi:hypothetical protein
LRRSRQARWIFEKEGELSAAIEVRSLFAGVTDNAKARECARTVWSGPPVDPRDRGERAGKDFDIPKLYGVLGCRWPASQCQQSRNRHKTLAVNNVHASPMPQIKFERLLSSSHSSRLQRQEKTGP